MIRNLLRKARRLPKPVRNRIALSLSGVFTALVGIIWISNISFPNETTIKPLVDDVPAFSQFLGKISDQVAAAKDSIKNATTTKNTIEYDAATATPSTSKPFGFSVSVNSSSSIEVEHPNSIEYRANSPRIVKIVTTTSTASTTAKSP